MNPLRRPACSIVTAVALLALAGCGDDATDPADQAGSTSSASGDAGAVGDESPSGRDGRQGQGGKRGEGDGPSTTEEGDAGEGDAGEGGGGGDGGGDGGDDGRNGDGRDEGGIPPETDPNSPFVVAASAVATRSRDQVLQLHAMAVATQPDAGFPRKQVAPQGKAIRGQIRQLIADATMAEPPADSAAAALVDALEAYQRLAGDVAAWDHGRGMPLPARFYRDLAAVDRAWKSALRDLSELSGTDLLENLPPLAMP